MAAGREVQGAAMMLRAPEFDRNGRTLPTFYGKADRKALVSYWGLPNAVPEPHESLFGRCRLLFVDDEYDGAPVCYWRPEPPGPRHYYWRTFA